MLLLDIECLPACLPAGLKAIMLGAQSIMLGSNQIVVAGGMESMVRRVPRAGWLWPAGLLACLLVFSVCTSAMEQTAQTVCNSPSIHCIAVLRVLVCCLTALPISALGVPSTCCGLLAHVTACVHGCTCRCCWPFHQLGGTHYLPPGRPPAACVTTLPRMQSNIPHYLPAMRGGARLGHSQVVDGLLHDGLWDAFHDIHMGECAGEPCTIAPSNWIQSGSKTVAVLSPVTVKHGHMLWAWLACQ